MLNLSPIVESPNNPTPLENFQSKPTETISNSD